MVDRALSWNPHFRLTDGSFQASSLGRGSFIMGGEWPNEEVGETCRVPKQISLINKPFQLGLIEYLLNSVAATCLLIKIIFWCKEEEPFQKVQ